MNKLYSSKSGQWDKAIAFSAKDGATMLNLPLSSVTRYMREGKLKTFKVGDTTESHVCLCIDSSRITSVYV